MPFGPNSHWIQFGKKPFSEWSDILDYLIDKIDNYRGRTDAKKWKKDKESFEKSIDWEFAKLRIDSN